MDEKRKLSIIFITISAILLFLGIAGVIIGTYLGLVQITTFPLWVSLAGILPLSVIFGIVALVFDISYRKQN